MSRDKHRSIFLRQMEAIVFIILQIFFTTRAVLKIGEYHMDIPHFWLGHIQSCEGFRPISLVSCKRILSVSLFLRARP